MTNSSEPTLTDISKALQEIKQVLADTTVALKEIKQTQEETKKRLETLDSRFFDFSMRIVSANSSAFFGVGIALLSAAIAFVVARVSSGF